MAKSEFKNIDIQTASKIYSQLKDDVTKAGILDRSYLYYFLLTSIVFTGFLVSSFAIFKIENYGYLLIACLAFTFFSVQFGGLMHDSGHRAVFSKVKNNDILGYFSGFFLGMVFDNWKIRHNAHHANPNHVEDDPDIKIPFIATSRELYLEKKGIEKWISKYQSYYYYPLGIIVSFSNRLGSFGYFREKRLNQNWWKILIYAIGIIFLFPLPFLIFDPIKAIFVFLIVHATSGIYLANCFAPNHKGMPQLKKGQKLTFLEQQIITARNITGGIITDTVLVGLNYQIEHHLFPNCPRNKLKLISPYVLKICKDLNLPYTSVNLIESNKIIVKELHKIPRLAEI